jgi:hypothetical protein
MSMLSIIMLAGSLRPSPLRAEVGEPVLRMPIRGGYCLLDAWLEALAGTDASAELRIVVNDLRDIDTLNGLLARRSRGRERTIGVIPEPKAWRGTAGLVRDLTEALPGETRIAVLEAGCLPLLQLREALEAMNDECSGVIVAGREREPAGISIFRRAALDGVSRVGYSDMKEQLIPVLHQKGLKITMVERDDPVLRIRDRRSYLHAIATWSAPDDAGEAVAGTVDPSARLIGCTVIEAGAAIEAGAIVHESVVMSGGRIGAGAVISRSVIGRNAVVEAGERVIEGVMGGSARGGRRYPALSAAE